MTSTVQPDRVVSTRPATSGSAGAVVATHGLTKRFGAQTVVDDLTLTVPRGAVYGFLGPNGCGKTTTIRMLLGLAFPTSGRIDLLGARLPGQATRVLHRVGALVEGPAFHPYLSGRANLHRLDAADVRSDARTSSPRIDAALDRVGLLPAARKRYRAYSLGMRQRLAIAGALLAPRDLLVLDEPTNGLDPQGTREVRNLVSSVAEDGMTVLVSSHLLSEVEQMCSHIAVMREGRLLAEGPIQELRSAGATTVAVLTREPSAAANTLRRLGLRDIRVDGERVRATPAARADGSPDATVTPEQMVDSLVAAGVPVRGFELRTPSLEDLFVELTGEGFDVSG